MMRQGVRKLNAKRYAKQNIVFRSNKCDNIICAEKLKDRFSDILAGEGTWKIAGNEK